MALTNKLSAIGNAIRSMTGKTDPLTLDEMPAEITSIQSTGNEKFVDLVEHTITEVTAGDLAGCTILGQQAFHGCNSLSSVTLPSTLKYIDHYAFYNCESLTSLTIPASVEEIGAYIGMNSGITTITFEGTPEGINSNAFTSNFKLKDIYVPWDKDAVLGAPWGASSVTIHYNGEV